MYTLLHNTSCPYSFYFQDLATPSINTMSHTIYNTLKLTTVCITLISYHTADSTIPTAAHARTHARTEYIIKALLSSHICVIFLSSASCFYIWPCPCVCLSVCVSVCSRVAWKVPWCHQHDVIEYWRLFTPESANSLSLAHARTHARTHARARGFGPPFFMKIQSRWAENLGLVRNLFLSKDLKRSKTPKNHIFKKLTFFYENF